MRQRHFSKNGKTAWHKRVEKDNSPVQLDAAKFAHLAPFLLNRLRAFAKSGARSAAAALNQLFIGLYGNHGTRPDRQRFFILAAPLARRVAIELANPNDRIGEGDITVSDLEEWLLSLETFDPLVAKMIDLHWFAGLSIEDTADALNLPPRDIVRNLSSAKARWQANRQLKAGPS